MPKKIKILKNKKILLIIPITAILLTGAFIINSKFAKTGTAVSRTDMTLNLNFGNNDAQATPKVYDSSGYNRTATAANAQTCNNSGCTFDGSGDYMTVPTDILAPSNNISLSIKFTPTFAADDGGAHYFFSGTNTTDGLELIKYNIGNVLYFVVGGAFISTIPLSTYQPYWKINQENVIVIRSKGSATADTDIFLNGNAIQTDGALTWTASNSYIGTIGKLATSTRYFPGKMHYFKVWNRLLTDNEVANLSADRETTITATSRTDTTLNLNFGNNNNAATPKVYDSSGYNRTATAVNAQTCNQNGCTFDTGDYMTVPAAGIIPSNTAVSIAIKFTPNYSASYDAYKFFYDGDGTAGRTYLYKGSNAVNHIIGINFGGTSIGGIPLATYQPYWKINQENVIIVRSKGSATADTDVFLNGAQIMTNNATAWSVNEGTNYLISAAFNPAPTPIGKLHYFKVWNRLLTDDEVANLSADRETIVQAPSRSGLVGYWNMDANDVNGTIIYDKSGTGAKGTITGAVVKSGKINQSMYFDGLFQYVDMFTGNSTAATSTLSPTNAVSVSAWINPSTLTNGDNVRGIVTNQDASITTAGYNLIWYSQSLFFIINSNAAGSRVVISFPSSNLNRWYHVVGTYNKDGGSNNLNIYVNGVKGTPTTCSTPIDYKTNQKFIIGRTYTYASYDWNGYIDDVRVYNRALSAQEVSDLYQSAKMDYAL